MDRPPGPPHTHVFPPDPACPHKHIPAVAVHGHDGALEHVEVHGSVLAGRDRAPGRHVRKAKVNEHLHRKRDMCLDSDPTGASRVLTTGYGNGGRGAGRAGSCRAAGAAGSSPSDASCTTDSTALAARGGSGAAGGQGSPRSSMLLVVKSPWIRPQLCSRATADPMPHASERTASAAKTCARQGLLQGLTVKLPHSLLSPSNGGRECKKAFTVGPGTSSMYNLYDAMVHQEKAGRSARKRAHLSLGTSTK